MKNIKKVANQLGLNKSQLYCYGDYMAKISPLPLFKCKANLILVTSINPTSSGEGKTTIAIALADSLNKLKRKCCLALREPSIGPVFGAKGGATGNSEYSLFPKNEINLHFTGDIHAITSANNLICAALDNHIYQGNKLNIDTNKICIHRCIDVNDRALRNIICKYKKVQRHESFHLTSASEIMSILCLSSDINDLKQRISKIIVAYDQKNKPIFVKDLMLQNAVIALLKDAIKPNLVQTLNSSPAIIHGGPFANLDIGCNSIIALKTALTTSEYTVTEAGLGADLGAQKFFDIMCRNNQIKPSCVVMVATIKALKEHGNGSLSEGYKNLKKHIDNIKNVYNMPVIVALNKFKDDNLKDIQEFEKIANQNNIEFTICDISIIKGGACKQLAKNIIEVCKKSEHKLQFCYNSNQTIRKKIISIAKNIYGAKNVEFSDTAKLQLKQYEKYNSYDIVMAKTQYSLSDNAELKNVPENFTVTIDSLILKNGANLIIAKCGNVLFMPALNKHPRCINCKIDNNLNLID